MKRIKVHSRRLLLQTVTMADHGHWQRSCAGRKAKTNVFDPGPVDPDQLTAAAWRARVQRWRSRSAADGFCVLGIFNRRRTLLYGLMDIHFLNRELGWANIGYEISNQYWGRGIATEAARLGLGVAFEHLAAHRVELGSDPDNLASLAVINKLGLHPEGLRRNFFPDEPGDLQVFGLSAPEYRASRQAQR